MRLGLLKQFLIATSRKTRQQGLISRQLASGIINSLPAPVPAAKIDMSEPVKKEVQQNVSDYIYPNNQPVVLLDCSSAFDALTESAKLYAHYLSRAAWYGGLIVLMQTSLESPLIFVLLRKVFNKQPVSELKEIALAQCELTEEEFRAFLVYACGIFCNMGNYKGYGDSKFIPNLPKEKFEKLILKSRAGIEDGNSIRRILDQCLEKLYSIKSNETHLGFPEKGVTTYLSKNFTKEDSDCVKAALKKEDLGGYNMRTIKTVDDSGRRCYDLKFASVNQTDSSEICATADYNVKMSFGDYKGLLAMVNKYLAQAKEHAANNNEVEMIDKYIKSFETGLLNFHKEGSRYWIKDVGPIVETYIGFIETYRDPDGIRGEFEGFVAVVNKHMSKTFSDLVQNAEKFLPMLPWPTNYEKDEFLRPDFTSLDVLTFSGSGIPAGICIPNYDEIRQNEGFKNVSLGNVIYSSLTGTRLNYISQEDQELLSKYQLGAFEVTVGLHELLGHGSGKLFREKKDGTFNFDRDSVIDCDTSCPITSWYKDGETYDVVFGPLGSSYEECRAECVALYLATEPEILSVFGYEDRAKADLVAYTSWFDMCHKGIESLQMYDVISKQFTQAHSQARYVILQVLLEAGNGLVNIKELEGSDGKPDLLLTVDKDLLNSVGKPAIGNFLRKLQLYRATADINRATELYKKYSEVCDKTYGGRVYPFMKYKEIVMARKKPRKIFVQANTTIEDGKVILHKYDSTHEGLIQSWIERFKGDNDIDVFLENWCNENSHHFTEAIGH